MTDTSEYEAVKQRASAHTPLNLGLNDGTYAPAAGRRGRARGLLIGQRGLRFGEAHGDGVARRVAPFSPFLSYLYF